MAGSCAPVARSSSATSPASTASGCRLGLRPRRLPQLHQGEGATWRRRLLTRRSRAARSCRRGREGDLVLETRFPLALPSGAPAFSAAGEHQRRRFPRLQGRHAPVSQIHRRRQRTRLAGAAPASGRNELDQRCAASSPRPGCLPPPAKERVDGRLDANVQIALRSFPSRGRRRPCDDRRRDAWGRAHRASCSTSTSSTASPTPPAAPGPLSSTPASHPGRPVRSRGPPAGAPVAGGLLDAIVDEDMSGSSRASKPRAGPPPALPSPRSATPFRNSICPRPSGRTKFWRIETSRGPLDVMLHPEGETWMLLQPLAFPYERDDERLLRWLLDASGSRGARLGLRDERTGRACSRRPSWRPAA